MLSKFLFEQEKGRRKCGSFSRPFDAFKCLSCDAEKRISRLPTRYLLAFSNASSSDASSDKALDEIMDKWQQMMTMISWRGPPIIGG